MRLKKFDLNLLVVLDALLTEQNVTRAAQRVNLSQPAVSSSLSRLREYFNDELLMQVGRNLVPTPLGKRLARPVRNLLIDAEVALDTSPSFDPATHNRNFRLVASSYISVVLIAEVIRRCSTMAPNITFEISPPEFWRADLIDKGDVDLLIMPQSQVSLEHPHELLLTAKSLCVACKSNTLVGEEISIEQYLALGHVAAPFKQQPGRPLHVIDQTLLKEYGTVRRIEVAVIDFYAIPHFIVGTNRIATMHEHLARRYAQLLPLKLLEPPLPVPTLDVSLQWNKQLEEDAGIIWLRELLQSVSHELWP